MFKSTGTTKRIAATLVAGAAALGVAACGQQAGGDATAAQASGSSEANAGGPGFPQGGQAVELDPAEFTVKIDNPYWPMSPGSRWVYRETDTAGTEEKAVVKVTDTTKTIANGIEARVVRDTVSQDGVPIEVTDDWYAQDSQGNIWYLGEDTAAVRERQGHQQEGIVRGGRRRAQAGIALPGHPEPGQTYRQEYYKGEAEDEGGVITVGRGTGRCPVRALRPRRPHDPRPRPDGTEGPGTEVLRAWSRSAAERPYGWPRRSR